MNPTQQLSKQVSCATVEEFREQVAQTLEAMQQLMPMLQGPIPNVPQARQQLADDLNACKTRLHNLRAASTALKGSLDATQAARLPMFDDVIAEMERDVAHVGAGQQTA